MIKDESNKKSNFLRYFGFLVKGKLQSKKYVS
jgi:hypothetical protein